MEKWLTCKEIAKILGYSDRNARRIAEEKLESGEWEFRFRKEPNHYTREYRRKRETLVKRRVKK